MAHRDEPTGRRAPRPSGPGRRRRAVVGWLARFALLFSSLAICFLALEVGLWWFGNAEGGWFAAGPQRLDFLARYVERNSDGFRDREFETGRPAGTLRILAVGDSFTFGDGIRDVDDTWPRVLERTLRTAGRPAQVYNLGIPGTNTPFQRRLLDEYAPRLEPDRIVVGFVLNDAEPPGAARAIVHREVFVPLIPIAAIDEPLTRVSYAYSWLRGKKNVIYARLGLKKSYADYLHGLYSDADNWNRFARDARGLVADARARGVPVTVALFPQFDPRGGPYRFDAEHDRVGTLFRAAGADVVDLREVYDGLDPASLMVSPSDAHPNEIAQRMAAEAIAASLPAPPSS